MKKLLFILILSLIGCGEVTQNTKEYTQVFKDGQLVYVGNEAFIVEYFDSYENTYWLKKIKCTSSECSYKIIGTDIRRSPNNNEYDRL